MPTVAWTKVNSYVEAVHEKVHNMQTDTFKLVLCDAAHPPSSATTKLSDLTTVSTTNTVTMTLQVTSSSQTSGTYKWIVADFTITATGAVGPFRYFVIYDDTATNDEVVCYADYGSEITLANGDTVPMNFDDTNGVFTDT
jgi:hypothetical protein